MQANVAVYGNHDELFLLDRYQCNLHLRCESLLNYPPFLVLNPITNSYLHVPPAAYKPPYQYPEPTVQTTGHKLDLGSLQYQNLDKDLGAQDLSKSLSDANQVDSSDGFMMTKPENLRDLSPCSSSASSGLGSRENCSQHDDSSCTSPRKNNEQSCIASETSSNSDYFDSDFLEQQMEFGGVPNIEQVNQVYPDVQIWPLPEQFLADYYALRYASVLRLYISTWNGVRRRNKYLNIRNSDDLRANASVPHHEQRISYELAENQSALPKSASPRPIKNDRTQIDAHPGGKVVSVYSGDGRCEQSRNSPPTKQAANDKAGHVGFSARNSNHKTGTNERANGAHIRPSGRTETADERLGTLPANSYWSRYASAEREGITYNTRYGRSTRKSYSSGLGTRDKRMHQYSYINRRTNGYPPLSRYNEGSGYHKQQNGSLTRNNSSGTYPFSASDGYTHYRDRDQDERGTYLNSFYNSHDRYFGDSRFSRNSRSQYQSYRHPYITRGSSRNASPCEDNEDYGFYPSAIDRASSRDTEYSKGDRGTKRWAHNRMRNASPIKLPLKAARGGMVDHNPENGVESRPQTPSSVQSLSRKSSKAARTLNSHYEQRLDSERKCSSEVELLARALTNSITVESEGANNFQELAVAEGPLSPENLKAACNALFPSDLIDEELRAIIVSWLEIIKDYVNKATKRIAECLAARITLPVNRISPIILNPTVMGLSEMDLLSESIWDYHQRNAQTDATLMRKLHLRDMIYYAISPLFPLSGLYIVGSSLNGFGSNASDMDLCLMITNKDLDQRTDAVVVLNMIHHALKDLKWVVNLNLILAKVPILRLTFAEPFNDIVVDLNANNSVAIRNTNLLSHYASYDWKVRPLVSIVKEWAKRKDINDANRSSFTSYSLVLMVIHYLQCGLPEPVLPSLQVLYPRNFTPNADVRCLQASLLCSPPVERFFSNDTVTLGDLLIGFFEYYAYKFDYIKDAISVRLGKKIPRTAVARQNSSHISSIAQWNCICIEEPFNLSNTAHSVHNQVVFDAIRQAFKDSHQELIENHDLSFFLNAKPIEVNFGTPSSSICLPGQSEMETPTPTMNVDGELDTLMVAVQTVMSIQETGTAEMAYLETACQATKGTSDSDTATPPESGFLSDQHNGASDENTLQEKGYRASPADTSVTNGLKEVSEEENQLREDVRSFETDDAKSEEDIVTAVSESEVMKPMVLTERLRNQLDSSCTWKADTLLTGQHSCKTQRRRKNARKGHNSIGMQKHQIGSKHDDTVIARGMYQSSGATSC